MRRAGVKGAAALALALLLAVPAGVAAVARDRAASDPAPAIPPVDAPELARPGRYPVGVAAREIVQPGQADPTRGADRPAIADRHLPLTIWYPAATRGAATTYHTALSGEDGRDVAFDVPGIAARDMRPAPAPQGRRFPLVILAHGYGNTPAVLAWLGENLASKGYVVVAPAFRDPPIGIRTATARSGPLSRRPLDIAFVARTMQDEARAGGGALSAADADRVVLIGYSMGGYGVLTAAGAPLNPAVSGMTRDVLAPFVSGGARSGDLRVAGVRAVVAIAPASRWADQPIWSGEGVAAVRVPTLFIAGDHDRVVGYDPGVRSLFDAQHHADRYLLTFHQAGHSIALSGAPAAMRRSFWDLDWLEDAVWRKDRLLAVQAHFITAFLDRYVKGEAGKAAYIDGLVPEADAGIWPGAPVGRYPGYSDGAAPVTVWKGFQPSRAVGIRFEKKAAS